jgi:hypothetical protein
MTVIYKNCIHEEIKRRFKFGNACYHSIQDLLFSHLLSKTSKIKVHKTIIVPLVFYGCETWSLMLGCEGSENKVLTSTFGSKRAEVTRD